MSLTFEPLFCRTDHGITLCPVKFNHPAREKRTRFKHFKRACKHCNRISLTTERQHTHLCAAKNLLPPSCAAAGTPWAEREPESQRDNMMKLTREERLKAKVDPSPVSQHTPCLHGRLRNKALKNADCWREFRRESPVWRYLCALLRPGCAAPPVLPVVWALSRSQSSAWNRTHPHHWTGYSGTRIFSNLQNAVQL